MKIALMTAAALALTIGNAHAQDTAHPGADGWTVLYEECPESLPSGAPVTPADCMVVSENDKGEVKVDQPRKCGGATRIRRKPQKSTGTK